MVNFYLPRPGTFSYCCLMLLVILTVIPSLAQKPKNFSVVIEDLTTRLENAHMTATPLRLAIVPFGNTQSNTSNRFGDYITESIIGKLNPGKYKIFERKRLDAILKEDELMLSDLMLPEAAQKLGKLVPIDALFSGTYTKLKTYIDVSARLIDVQSGEILVSFSGRIKMTKNLKILFPLHEEPTPDNSMTVNIKSAPAVKTEQKSEKPTAEVCKQRVAEFNKRLSDLSTDEKVRSVVKEAMGVPFDNQCGAIHYDVMYYFTRYKIKRPEYEMFLQSTLDTILFPPQDDRAFHISRFMERDSLIDEREWKVGLRTIAKIGDYSLSTYISYFIGRPQKNTDQEIHDRIDTYFSLVASHKIGLPIAISGNQAFFEMMEGLRYQNRKYQVYCYEKYSSIVTLDTRSASLIYSELETMYKEEEDPQVKTKIMNWLCDFFINHADEKSGEHLFDLAFSSQFGDSEDRNMKIKKEFPRADVQLLVERCREKFSEYAMKVPYKSQQEDRINFCIKYGIPIGGVIPSLTEAETALKGNDLDKQLETMKVLVQMGSKPKSLENALVGLFAKRSLDDKEKLTEIQTLAMKTLGNIKSSSPTAIDHMISKLESYNYAESDNATVALIQIGKPSVTPLTNRLSRSNQQEGGLRYKLIVILGKIGPAAKPAEPVLRKVLADNTNSDVKYAIEAALQQIR